jgi:NitT/TauT family transport system permease protein
MTANQYRLKQARSSEWLYPTLAVIAVVIVWHVAVLAFNLPSYLLPSPMLVMSRLYSNWKFLLFHTWVTTYETIGGFLLSVIVGVSLGMAIVWSSVLDRTITPLLVLSQTFPKVAIASAA